MDPKDDFLERYEKPYTDEISIRALREIRKEIVVTEMIAYAMLVVWTGGIVGLGYLAYNVTSAFHQEQKNHVIPSKLEKSVENKD